MDLAADWIVHWLCSLFARRSIASNLIGAAPKEGKVIVEGANMIHKHVKPRRQGETGGIVDAEGAIYSDKVALYCSKCDKGVRVHNKVVDGKKVRVCAHCGKEI